MHQTTKLAAALAVTLIAPMAANANNSRSIPSVVVTVENSAPSRGALQTPVWAGIHDGSFDLYDRGVALGAGATVPAPAVERLAEDGAVGPLNEAFAAALPYSPQTTLFGPSGPLAPGDTSSVTLNVDPSTDRYFSYASMVIPSNDAFIANGNPLAHQLFDNYGRFTGTTFAVTGAEVLDAGTEVNDEIAANTAFLNQGGPDIGETENGVVTLHEGFRSDLSFPDGVLNHPVFGLADFRAPAYRAATFSFRYIDLGRTVVFNSDLSPENEVGADFVQSDASGRAFAIAVRGDTLFVRIFTRNLSGPIQMAHLHNGAKGVNGPVVVNLASGIRGNNVFMRVRAQDVLGDLAATEDPALALLNEVAAGNIYINLHTAENPAGELRGQLRLR